MVARSYRGTSGPKIGRVYVSTQNFFFKKFYLEIIDLYPENKMSVFGQVNQAVTLNNTFEQWVDLGVLPEACITRPETCSAAGAALSFWLKVTGHDSEGTTIGILSSRTQTNDPTGFVLTLTSDKLR